MVSRKDFAHKQDLADALADRIVQKLSEALQDRPRASLAVSGGSTPKLLFQTLSTRDDLDWSKVDVTLVDERWVPETSDRSNAKLVIDNLMQGAAAASSFVPLYSGDDYPTEVALQKSADALSGMAQPFDVAILGMGNDGHTASFFPGGDTLAQALTSDGPLIALEAEGAGEPRVTLTLPVLAVAGDLILHIEGDAKAETLNRALADGAIEDMPVRAVLRHATAQPIVYWCP